NNSGAVGVMVQNVPPVAADVTVSTDEDVNASGVITANDANGDVLTYAITTPPNIGSASIDSSGNWTYTPTNRTANYTAVFTVTIADGATPTPNTDTARVTINVVANDDPPTISNILNQSTNVGVTVGPIPFTIDDVDTPIGTLTLDVASSNTALVTTTNIILGGGGANRTVTITPTAGMTGTATITVTVNDGSLSSYDTFVLAVGVNGPPEFTSIPVETAIAGEPYTYTITAADADAGDVLTITAPISAAWLTLTKTSTRTATLSGTPPVTGAVPIELDVTDGEKSASQAFTITVSSRPAPALQIVKTVEGTGGALNLSPNSIVTYTITLNNSGSGDATGVLMTDNLPGGVSFGGWVNRGGAEPLVPTGVITWTGNVSAGTSHTIRFTAIVTTSLTFSGKTISNTATFISANAGSGSDDAVFTIVEAHRIYLPLVARNY
ncbi:MAG: Ig-like domain-containing protein, partial [Anaerolineae bacterium]